MAASLPQIGGLPVEVEQVVDSKVGDFQISGTVAKVALHGLDDLTGQPVTDKPFIPGEGNRFGLATAEGIKFLPGQRNIKIIHIVTSFRGDDSTATNKCQRRWTSMKDARTAALDELKEKLEAMDLAELKQLLGFIAGVNAGSAANAA